MKNLLQKKFIVKFKKTIIFLLSVILITGLALYGYYEYNQKGIGNKKNEGIALFKDDNYEKATEILNDYLTNYPDDNEVKEIISIIKIYNDSKAHFDKGNFELVISTLDTIPEKANDYPIKSKIDELKNNTNNSIKKKEIEAVFVELKALIDNEDYTGAKDIITKLETMELSNESDVEELAKNKKLVEDYFIDKDKLEANKDKLEEDKELSANKESPKPTNKQQTENNSEAKQPYIANTSAAKNSSQLLTITSTGGSSGELIMWEKDSHGVWYEYDRMYARLGSGGMKEASEVYEMDKCTPTGVYSLTEAFGVAENPGSGVRYKQLDGSEYWIDDSNSQYYNTMEFGEANGRWQSAEHLIDYKNAYKYSLVIDYNRWPTIPGKSSAIFLHVDTGIPTLGCVAVAQDKMVKILNWINPSSNPKIILGFDDNYISKF
ncbi:L,D-transpeptidase family protein [Clostridium gasigenes]|uniref:L,D-transpeptidase family protein n=1 Tax=Clostridium gasigenes TaxID=94869 RepID=UPI001C0BA6A2|nr:L,D-transpeptidase family protein [Clostridium gasigenes]MBU3109030.1 L,D-transpeptidase family protein [Clostridium gasigenes]